MGNNTSRYGPYAEPPYPYDRGMPYGPHGMQGGWSDTYKRSRSNSAAWYPGEMGYRQPASYIQGFPQLVTSALFI